MISTPRHEKPGSNRRTHYAYPLTSPNAGRSIRRGAAKTDRVGGISPLVTPPTRLPRIKSGVTDLPAQGEVKTPGPVFLSEK